MSLSLWQEYRLAATKVMSLGHADRVVQSSFYQKRALLYGQLLS